VVREHELCLHQSRQKSGFQERRLFEDSPESNNEYRVGKEQVRFLDGFSKVVERLDELAHAV